MLKALELSGFKSFADKTRFDFPPGITVVVGPNGSGKSNIVDAIKWVLGEQSAKSLRGKDMSDVIFKGSSGANARKAANSASATIILDNADGRLLNDAPEIHVTRRVYRSGESEYLINNEPCRLKDIRQLFRGTGVGTDAYSLIEQGKVERLLQAGAKDRRAIFEEAAGISRFKAQKVEAERRLERVQVNLTRLADIVEEVGSRFRAIKNQASKAAKYKEYTERLQALRTYVGAKDFRSLSDKIAQVTEQIAEREQQTRQSREQVEQLTAQHRVAEQQVDSVAQAAEKLQADITQIRERILQSESTAELNRQRQADFTARIDQVRNAAEKARQRLKELEESGEATREQLRESESRLQQASQQLADLEQRTAQQSAAIQELTEQSQNAAQQTSLTSEQIRQLVQEINQVTVQIELQRQNHQKQDAEWNQLEEQFARLKQQLETADAQAADLQQKAQSADSALANAQQAVDSMLHRLSELQHQLSDAKSEYAGVSQRAKVIEELEKRQEGVSTGAQELSKLAKASGNALSDSIIGMVADLIEVNVQHAALVDAALGERSQWIIVRGGHVFDALASGDLVVSGRVGIIDADQFALRSTAHELDLNDRDGVVGAASTLVRAAGTHHGLVRRLLQGTWIVKDLAVARELHRETAGQVRLVTLGGEVLEQDGTWLVGPKSSSVGLISRRSELRELLKQSEALKQTIAGLELTIQSLKSEIKTGEAQVQQLLGENQTLSKALAGVEANQTGLNRDLERTGRRREAVLSEREASESRIAKLAAQMSSLEETRATAEADNARWKAQQEEFREKAERLKSEQQEMARQETVAKVQLAKWEQQQSDFVTRWEAIQGQQVENRETVERTSAELTALEQGIADAESILSRCRAEHEEMGRQRESLTEEYNGHHVRRLELDQERKSVAKQLQATRESLREGEDLLGKLALRLQQMEMEREQLAARLMEDYGISVAEVESAPTPEQLETRDDIDREITELRQRIGSLGAVNMQALAELEELESRYQSLDRQYRDLVEARDALLKIIQKINQDSRRLFVETLEAIRTNFQKLFRQTFGGGQADIILEEGVDVLEAGVEITATPPGKPKFNNSLLSGGEKALTAVSLLMAIFQFRPSPFCVLDEVDAPFDEANIGRFIDVLKSFLGWTKFVIVTHSKKTMTAATTLYGITMQESGVSKRVSVKFEDVSEDGEISQDAINREPRDGDGDRHEVQAQAAEEQAAGEQPAA